MPLTPINRAYKKFPRYLADRVTRRGRRGDNVSPPGAPSDASPKEIDVADRSLCFNRFSASLPSSPEPSSSGIAGKTKRPTIVSVSDGESDSETNSSSVVSPRSFATPSPRPVSIDCFSAQTQRTRRNSRLAQTSPRMAVSLDNVDLWEESDSESDSSGSQHYDKIDGVYINPRKTMDFSDLASLRSPLACKRNRLDKIPQNLSSTLPQPLHTPTLTAPVITRNKRKSKECDVLKDFRVRHKLKMSTDVSTNVLPRISKTNCASEEKRTLNGDVKRSPNARSSKQQNGHPLNSSPSASFHAASLRKSSQRLQTDTVVHKLAADLDDKAACLDVRATMRTPEPTTTTTTQIDDLVDSVSCSPNSRKVKFNNFVKVREGELNTLDLLRNSHNSAQMFKNKYIGNNSAKSKIDTCLDIPSETSPKQSDPSKEEIPRTDKPWRIQIVC